jgi:hypothetical protein
MLGVMPIAAITVQEFEQLRPPRADDHFWFRHDAVAWYATADRVTIAVVDRSSGEFNRYVTFQRKGDGTYGCTSTGTGMTSVEHAAKVIGASVDHDAC